MSEQRPLDRGIFIPIGIGILSITGIILILLTVYLDQSKASAVSSPSPTPFKYLLLATETLTPELVEADIPENTPSEEEEASSATPPAAPDFSVTLANTDALATNASPGVTSTLSINDASVFTEGMYDDIDERIAYTGSWINEIVESAYGETMFISTTTGDTAAFTFIGTQLQIGYLADPTFGTAIVSIDGVEYSLDQSSGSKWLSPELPFGEYPVILTHENGELIVLDYINIIGSP